METKRASKANWQKNLVKRKTIMNREGDIIWTLHRGVSGVTLPL